MNAPIVLAVCAVMVGCSVLVLTSMRVSLRWEPLWAITRAALQLAALTLVLQMIVTSIMWVIVFLAVMLVVASFTAVRRIDPEAFRNDRTLVAVVVTAIAAGLVVAVSIAFLTGAVAFGTQYLLAIGGIVTGNLMAITTITGKRMREQLHDYRGEVEGWLALGAKPSLATIRLRREAVKLALIPSIDSAKTTGLVTLPGAFVGAVFAGASPVDAGLFQLIVLSCLQLGCSITAVIYAQLLANRTS